MVKLTGTAEPAHSLHGAPILFPVASSIPSACGKCLAGYLARHRRAILQVRQGVWKCYIFTKEETEV